MTHLDAIEDRHPFLHHVDRITVEVRSAEFELGEILDRPQAALSVFDFANSGG
jgi:hypothetical protein